MSPGDLVACVNAGVIRGALNKELHLLTLGDVYTIGDVDPCPYPDGYIGIALIEIYLGKNEWWHSARFRPCRKTNIDDLIASVREREAV